MSVYSDPYQQGAGQGPYANSYPHMRTGCGLGWKPIELVAMILGFIVFWPIGLAILFAKMWQRKHGYSGDIPSFVESRLREKWRENWQSKWQEKWETKMGRWACHSRDFGRGPWEFRGRSSGNVAFDEWREAELARLEEERQKLLAAEREFADFMENLRRAKDREEFDRFMAARHNRGSESAPPPPPPA